MKVLGVITARSGSKRVPNKNTKFLNGKPLITYTFETATKAKSLDRIVLSTDDPKAIEEAGNFPKIEVPFIRPKDVSNDDSADIDVFRHLISFIKYSNEQLPELIVHLRPTSPLRTSEQIDLGVMKLRDNPQATAVRSVIEFETPIFKLYNLVGGYLASPMGADVNHLKDMPNQYLPKTYRHVGYVDVVRTSQIIKYGSMTGDYVLPLILEGALPGINTPEDFEMYENILTQSKNI